MQQIRTILFIFPAMAIFVLWWLLTMAMYGINVLCMGSKANKDWLIKLARECLVRLEYN